MPIGLLSPILHLIKMGMGPYWKIADCLRTPFMTIQQWGTLVELYSWVHVVGRRETGREDRIEAGFGNRESLKI